MNARTERLREQSLTARPTLSPERALLLTAFHREHEGHHSPPVLRALAFRHLCEHRTLYLGADELIVGERGPAPKVVPTYPELTCHSLEDLRILDSRPLTAYVVPAEMLHAYAEQVIPYWSGRTMRERIFAAMTPQWRDAYDAGLFTEFMEQRGPGHTALDDKIYRRGLLERIADIQRVRAAMAGASGPAAVARREELQAMEIACEAVILLAGRHAALAAELAAGEADPVRRRELERIAGVCRWVPAHAPRDFHEALQAYWFCHLAVVTEMNGWDSFSPGHLDQHLLPFYRRGLADGTLAPESARELLECLFVKFNDHPAPPKVGVTAAESGTYNDFANLNLGGLLPDGENGANEVTHLLLDVLGEMHLLQPGSNLQVSRETPDDVLAHALRVVHLGHGFPALFNADAVVLELLRQGKTLEDARAGGCTGCVEAGAFGKEAYVLTGYVNLPKLLELALHDGVDPRSGRRIGPSTGDPRDWTDADSLLAAFRAQLRHLVDVKIAGNQVIERLYAENMPVPFLSVLIDDCIERGTDYHDGGARYNTRYLQGVGLGSIADGLAALDEAVFRSRSVGMDELLAALDADFAGHEPLRLRLVHRMPKYGNDDDRADTWMLRVFEEFLAAVDGRPTTRGGRHHIQLLPTTCHVYFGAMTGALPDGRHAGRPFSEGISPVQGADRHGPTAVLRSAAKLDHLRTGGTLLNLKLAPALMAGDDGLAAVAHLVRGYFRLNGHHVQFNVVGAETLHAARRNPGAHRDLMVRVAGYSDYFCDLPDALQLEIISRTEHGAP